MAFPNPLLGDLSPALRCTADFSLFLVSRHRNLWDAWFWCNSRERYIPCRRLHCWVAVAAEETPALGGSQGLSQMASPGDVGCDLLCRVGPNSWGSLRASADLFCPCLPGVIGLKGRGGPSRMPHPRWPPLEASAFWGQGLHPWPGPCWPASPGSVQTPCWDCALCAGGQRPWGLRKMPLPRQEPAPAQRGPWGSCCGSARNAGGWCQHMHIWGFCSGASLWRPVLAGLAVSPRETQPLAGSSRPWAGLPLPVLLAGHHVPLSRSSRETEGWARLAGARGRGQCVGRDQAGLLLSPPDSHSFFPGAFSGQAPWG